MNASQLTCLLFAALMTGSISAQPGPAKPLTPKEEIENLEFDQERLRSKNKSLHADLNAKINQLHDLAAARSAEGNYREAQNKIILAYEAFEASGSEDNEARQRHLRLLCNVTHALGENDKTIFFAIEIAIYAEGSEDRAIACNALGLAYAAKGELDKAIKFHEKSLGIRVTALGPKHPDVAVSCINLGNAYRDKGEHDKAIERYLKAEEIYTDSFELNHPHLGITYNNLGEVHRAKGEYEAAIEHYQKSLAIKSKLLGSEHPSVVITSTNLANTYLSLGVDFAKEKDPTHALENLSKAKTTYLALDQNHPHLAQVYLSIGAIHLENEEKQLALENLTKAKDSFSSRSPENLSGANQAQALIDKIN